jgi:NTE family protein
LKKHRRILTDIPYDITLVLSGGDALGAYQGGAYEALADHGIEPAWVIGASAGAVNGTIRRSSCGERAHLSMRPVAAL